MVATDTRRASGRTTAEEATKEVSRTADEPISVQLPEERIRKFSTTGFNRMSLDWNNDDKIMMTRIHAAVEKKLDEYFGDLITMQYELLMLVRECETDAAGNPIPDDDGLPKWKRSGAGGYVEDWGRLTGRERVNWIFKLQSNIVDWEQRSNQAWAEAMFMKAKWEDAFSVGFELLPGTKPTVQDREARGKLESRDERYFAIMVSYYSRSAESYVRNMRDLLLRMSQVHQAASGR